MQKFLQKTDLIDFDDAAVYAQAMQLSHLCKSDEEIAKNCFIFVLDEINHSGDVVDDTPTTYKASDVLKHRTGWCYAKSILLAALLRANKIPTAFCYQRLSCSEYVKDIYCLHGLNAIYLQEFGWYRVDARGNKEGVNAGFNPPFEELAFTLTNNEYDVEGILEDPLPEVVAALKSNTCYSQMIQDFPDIKSDV